MANWYREGKVYRFYGVDNNCFKLNNSVFEAVEDEDNGYRSYLDTVELSDKENLIFFDAPLALVTVQDIGEGELGEDRGYRLVDAVDGHIWLQFYTDNTDDYYPCFRFEYEPKEMVRMSK